jgi:hypothetical protein
LQTIERIDLTDQMALAQASNGRIAGHRTDGSELMGQKCGSSTHARGCSRRFAPGMAATNHDDVENLRML